MKYHTQDKPFNCVQTSIACILDLEIDEVPFSDPCNENETSEEFWQPFVDFCEEQGLQLNHYGPDPLPDLPGLYIAHVPSLNSNGTPWVGETHAVIMDRDKLVWDCSRNYKRTRKPKKFDSVTIIEPKQ